jgi:alpha-ribazole phosphatase
VIAALVRHPRPLVAAGICYGRLDLAEHDDAGGQIAMAVQSLGGFSAQAIRASPALRCAGMAAAVADAQGIPTAFDRRLLEMNFGTWEGQRWDDLPRAEIDLWAADVMRFTPPGGENGAALVARVAGFADQICGFGRDCVVISHAGPLKVLRALLSRAPIDLLAPSMPIGGVEFVTVSEPARPRIR